MACTAPTITVGGVELSTSTSENAQALINDSGDDNSDVTQDEFESSVAGGNNDAGTTGIQIPPPTQTSPPPPISETPKDTNDTPPPNKNSPPTTCQPWDGQNYDFQISPNFILRYFTIGFGTNNPSNAQRGCMFPNQLTDVEGFDKQTRFCNLMALSQHVCEPLFAKFPNMRINSAIRNQNSVSHGVSQHVKGEACDIQMTGWTYQQYWDNADWVKNNIDFDQFIFEHSEKSGLAWYHLSFSQAKNRGMLLTMFRNQYSPGLKKMF
ncbi:MAG: hypothetical protein C5B52_08285 [Bacteroidetes bacterium]|nr:MAG: hypothetical protein C5B52_08285 [Bacteroidota bacterium]